MQKNTIGSEFGALSWNTALIPFLFVLFMWVVKYVELKSGIRFSSYGIYPGDPSTLYGIFTNPFIHADFTHLLNNSWSFIFLGTAIRYFYRDVFWKVFWISLFAHGIVLYFIGRPSYHIGASGMVYAFASFLFCSGLIRRHPQLLSASLIVVFLYGSLVWGVLPIVDHMSWEAHLSGAVVGLVLSVLFRKIGPQRKVYEWEDEDEEEDKDYLNLRVIDPEEVLPQEQRKSNQGIQIQYHFRKK